MAAQQNQTSIPGTYYLTNIMEMASGFRLEADNSFQFFFSYGALDRYGKGTWVVKNGEIVLNSEAKPLHDFSLLKSEAVADDDSITIQIVDKNKALISHVYAIVSAGGKRLEKLADADGRIQFPKQAVNSITLIFEFSAERSSTFSITNAEHNYFEFAFLPTIVEVFFENFILHHTPGKLTGQHPLLEPQKYVYQKEEE